VSHASESWINRSGVTMLVGPCQNDTGKSGPTEGGLPEKKPRRRKPRETNLPRNPAGVLMWGSYSGPPRKRQNFNATRHNGPHFHKPTWVVSPRGLRFKPQKRIFYAFSTEYLTLAHEIWPARTLANPPRKLLLQQRCTDGCYRGLEQKADLQGLRPTSTNGTPQSIIH
jgi:hypothetical protein